MGIQRGVEGVEPEGILFGSYVCFVFVRDLQAAIPEVMGISSVRLKIPEPRHLHTCKCALHTHSARLFFTSCVRIFPGLRLFPWQACAPVHVGSRYVARGLV